MNNIKGTLIFLQCGSTSAINFRLESMPKGIRSFRIPFGTDYTAVMATIVSLPFNSGWELDVRYEDQQPGAEYAEVTELIIDNQVSFPGNLPSTLPGGAISLINMESL